MCLLCFELSRLNVALRTECASNAISPLSLMAAAGTCAEFRAQKCEWGLVASCARPWPWADIARCNLPIASNENRLKPRAASHIHERVRLTDGRQNHRWGPKVSPGDKQLQEGLSNCEHGSLNDNSSVYFDSLDSASFANTALVNSALTNLSVNIFYCTIQHM